MPEGTSFAVRPGTDAAHTVVELSPDDWSCLRLGAEDLLRPPLRRAAHRPSGQLRPGGPLGAAAAGRPQRIRSCSTWTVLPALTTKTDAPLDLARTFTLDDPRRSVRDFLHRAGFVHLRGVLDAAEIAALTRRRRGGGRTGAARRPEVLVDDRRRARGVQPGELPQREVGRGSPRWAPTPASSPSPPWAATTCATPTIGSTATASSSRCPDRPGAWPTCPGTAIAAWAATRSSAPCSTSGSSSMPPRRTAGQLQMIPGSHRGTSRLPSAA